MRSLPTSSARSFRTQYIAVAVVPALIVTLSITGFVWAQKQVNVVVDGSSASVRTQAADVAGLLDQARIDVAAGDVVTPPRDAKVSDGMTVVVRHAVPVTIHMGDDDFSLNVVGTTVADALVAAGADPSANPAVSPAIDAPLERGMTISIPDSFARVTQVDVEVPFATESHEDPSLPKGTQRVIVPGSNGLALRVYRSVVTNGVEGAPVITAEKVVTPAVSQVVAVGAGVGAVTEAIAKRQLSAARVRPTRVLASGPRFGRRLRVVATGYSAAESGMGDHTATGHQAVRGVVAVDPKVIPLGTRLYVPGYGFAVASDTGGAIRGNRMDLCFDSVAECDAWGRRPVVVIILD